MDCVQRTIDMVQDKLDPHKNTGVTEKRCAKCGCGDKCICSRCDCKKGSKKCCDKKLDEKPVDKNLML